MDKLLQQYERGIIDRLDMAIRAAMLYVESNHKDQSILVKMAENFNEDNLLLRTFLLWAGVPTQDVDSITQIRSMIGAEVTF